MSKRVSASEQGQLQGANSGPMGMASMIGPLIFTLRYSWAIDPASSFNFSGTPFLLAALVLGVALAIGMRVTAAHANERSSDG